MTLCPCRSQSKRFCQSCNWDTISWADCPNM